MQLKHLLSEFRYLISFSEIERLCNMKPFQISNCVNKGYCGHVDRNQKIIVHELNKMANALKEVK